MVLKHTKCTEMTPPPQHAKMLFSPFHIQYLERLEIANNSKYIEI